MSYFKRIALLKAQQNWEPPIDVYCSDLVEICYLGAVIENDVEYVTIPVSPFDTNPYQVFEKSLKDHKFDFVGISTMTGGYNHARQYARIAREAGAYVVMGGYHPTALTDDVLADPNVDAVIRGEGDWTLKDLVNNGPSKDVLGLSFKEKDEPIHNIDRPLIQEMDSLPQPLRSIRPLRFGENGDDYTIDTLYSSRGCIAKCTFCANDTMNQQFRARSPEHFIEELKLIHNKHLKKTIKFWDSIFLFDANRVERIVELMFKNDLTNFKIITESRSDDVIRCKHLMKELKRIGFDKIQVGVESPDKETFKRLRKGGSIQKHEAAIEIVQKAGIKCEGFLIIGHPHETKEDILKYPEFAKQMGLGHRALYFVMTPYPGTQIYREYEEKKLIDSFDWDCYNNFGTVVHLENMERSELRNLLSYCYGATHGIPFIFNKQKSVPAMVFHFMYISVIMLFLYDIQRRDDKQSRNSFMWDFYKAGFNKYQKSRKMKSRFKFSMLFIRKFSLRILLDGEQSVVFHFRMQKDQIYLDVHKDSSPEIRMITMTLDDFDTFHKAIEITDVFNGAMFDLMRHAPKIKLIKGFFHCFPTMTRISWAFAKFCFKTAWRYITWSKPVQKLTPLNQNQS